MGSRDAEHTQWNLDHGLKVNEHLPLVCPRCTKPHVETLTSDPKEPDYCHHVHQCTYCGLRFELYVRSRSTHEVPKEESKIGSSIAKMVIDNHKDPDGWMEMLTALGLVSGDDEESPLVAQYFDYHEYASVEIEVDEKLNIVGGRFIQKSNT